MPLNARQFSPTAIEILEHFAQLDEIFRNAIFYNIPCPVEPPMKLFSSHGSIEHFERFRELRRILKGTNFILPKLISSTLKRISSFGTLFSAKFGKRDPRHRSNGKFKTVNCHVCSIDSARGSGIPLQARHNTVEGRYLIVAGRDYARPQQWASLCEEKRGEMVSRGLNKSRPIGYRRLNKEYRAGSMPSANIFCYALLFLPKLVFPPRLRPSDSFSFPNLCLHSSTRLLPISVNLLQS